MTINWNEQITPHFAWWEAAVTGHRPLIKLNRDTLEGSPNIRMNVVAFAGEIERFRTKHGKVWHINSWFRCPDLNAAVGGQVNSRHLLGTAIDFVVPGQPVHQTFNELHEILMRASYAWDELILEPRGSGNEGWVHFSALPRLPGYGLGRRLVLT